MKLFRLLAIASAIFLGFAILRAVLSSTDPQPRTTPTAAAAPRPAPPPLSEREQRIRDEAGKRPNEGWTVPWTSVDDYLRAHLKDPKSLEYVQHDGPFLIERDGRFAWQLRVSYRARNGFGGYVVERGTALVRHDKVVEWSSD